MVSFIGQIIFYQAPSYDLAGSTEVIQYIVEAMELEGNYKLKPACYNIELVNPEDPTCLHGAPWNAQYSQRIMGGELPGNNNTLVNNDNFHRVYSIMPVHLPEVDTTCTKQDTGCQLETITVTENHYELLNHMDTGFYPVGAWEMKSKMSSRQRVQQSAGVQFADFHELDEVGNRCAEINDFSLQWAYQHLRPEARANYDEFGVKLVTGDDLGPFNEGPLWIWHFLQYNETEDGSQVVLQSPMMRTPTDYFVQSAAGFHYCKVMSPFRAMEWMMTDGLFKNNGIHGTSNEDYKSFDLFLQ